MGLYHCTQLRALYKRLRFWLADADIYSLVLDQDNKFPCLLNLHLSIWSGPPLFSVSSSPPCRQPVFQPMIVESVRTRSHQTLPVLGAGDRQGPNGRGGGIQVSRKGGGHFSWEYVAFPHEIFHGAQFSRFSFCTEFDQRFWGQKELDLQPSSATRFLGDLKKRHHSGLRLVLFPIKLSNGRFYLGGLGWKCCRGSGPPHQPSMRTCGVNASQAWCVESSPQDSEETLIATYFGVKCRLC